MANVPRNGFFRVAEAKLTVLVGVVGLLVLLSAQSDYPDLFGRYSWRYAAILVAYALIMLGATILLTRQLPLLPDWLVLLGAAAGLLIVAWLPLLSHTWDLSVTLKLSFTWVVIAFAIHSRAVIARWQTAIIVIVLCIQAVSVLTLKNYPDMHISDEGWSASVGWTFAHKGILYSGVNQGVFGIPERFVPTANVLPGYWFEAAGVGLFQARLVDFFGGMLFLATLYVAAHQLYGNRDVAAFTVLAVASTYPFLINNHYFRLETYLGASIALSLYFYLRAHTHPRLGVISGFALAGAIEIHQNAFLLYVGSSLFLALWAFYRILRGRRAIQPRDFFFVLGGMLGGLLFVGLHVLPDPAEFVRQFHNAVGYRQEVYAVDNFDEWGPLRVVIRILEIYKAASPVELVTVVSVTVLALRRNPERLLAILTICILAVFTIFAPTFLNFYLIYFSPLIGLMFSGVLREWIKLRRAAALVMCLAIAMPMMWVTVKANQDGRNTRLLGEFARVASTLDRNERVAAPQIFFFVMPDNPNLMALFMPRYARMADRNVLESQVWERYHPNVFILYGPEEDRWGEIYREQNGFIETERFHDPNLPYDVLVFRRAAPTQPGD